ncbi:MAG TPA: ABC transporter permease subunit [Terriglobia bacterium]|nr:ABC transporter permease subunit [Terriglobia bacterium]
MEKILLLARNAFMSILYRRVLYLWIAAICLLILRSLPAIFFDFGNPGLQSVMRQRAVSGALDTWSTLCIALAIFMGASAIGSEVTAKTIVSVFSRPVRRWEFLLGKWIGIQAFAILSLFLGLLVSFVFGVYLDAEFEYKILAASVAQTALAICLYSGLALALSVGLGSALAGALAVIIAFMPALVIYLVDSPNGTNQAVGVVLDYVIPPGYTSHYPSTIDAPIPLEAFTMGRGRGNRRGSVPSFMAQQTSEPDIDYDSEVSTLLKNGLYAGFFFVLGCVAFSRRELRLA